MKLPYRSKPASTFRERSKIASLRRLQFRSKIWHFGKRYVRSWVQKVAKYLGERRKK